MGTPAKPDWYPDPTGHHDVRYWNGEIWTEHVHSNGTQQVDPMTSAPAVVASDGLASPGSARPAPPQSSARTKVPFFGARKVALEAQAEIQRLQGLIDKYGLKDVADLDFLKASLGQEIAHAHADLDSMRAQTDSAMAERDSVRAEIVDLRQAVGLQEIGLFNFENPAESSVTLATELESVRSQIKQAVSAGQATSAIQHFNFNSSAAKGAKFVRDMSKLMLRSYNSEAENGIKTVRAGNLPTAQKRLSTAVDQIARLGTMIDLRITPYYHSLRLKELELASRHLQALQAEKELERERREELRQQRQAEAELAREKERLEKERAHYANVIEALLAKGDVEGAERARAQLSDVDRAIEDVDYRTANIRAGYVYVISNIGAFGPGVVKIGMTRRLDPMDRVNELGDASVPFRFDVHALFFAEDAVAVEATLHQHFSEQRLNRVNLRREYFRATPAEVLEALQEHHVEVLEYAVEPAAEEFRASIPAS